MYPPNHSVNHKSSLVKDFFNKVFHQGAFMISTYIAEAYGFRISLMQ